jgi:hypothetical protein
MERIKEGVTIAIIMLLLDLISMTLCLQLVTKSGHKSVSFGMTFEINKIGCATTASFRGRTEQIGVVMAMV